MESLFSYWRKGSVRSLTYQWGLVVAILLALFWLFDTANTNLDRLGINTGFDFLDDEAGFQISQALFPYSAQSTYIDALLVTFTNTIVLSLIAICLATFLGFFIALSRLSDNMLLRKFGDCYVEVFRNVPLLLQLFFWYFAALKLLPAKRESINFFDIAFLNIEGFVIPAPILEDGATSIVWAIVIALALAIGVWRWAKRRQTRTGVPFPSFLVGLAIVIFIPLLVAWIKGFPISWEIPKFGRFNFEGGVGLQPEFTAMLFGLTLYNGAFIGEIIRAGILSVHKGQREAANSIGFTQMQIYSQIIVPQAMRLIIPPLTNQYLNLTKSTALAAALGYPDFFWALSGAIAAQTGQVLELQAITLFGYLGISLFIAAIMAIYNRATRIPER
ncbi:MAG: amino acid ABC transporter permease [Rhodospirillaceae bacterium]|nr:amino acid ABC transporter permease [Rhodospirillaceae bacterium]